VPVGVGHELAHDELHISLPFLADEMEAAVECRGCLASSCRSLGPTGQLERQQRTIVIHLDRSTLARCRESEPTGALTGAA
jgi:hypothetical protein